MNDSLYRDLGVLRQLTDRWNKDKLLTAVWPVGKKSLAVKNGDHTFTVRPESSLLFGEVDQAYPIDAIHRVLGMPVIRRADGRDVTFHHFVKDQRLQIQYPGGSEVIPAIDGPVPTLPAGAPYQRSCGITIPADSWEFVARAMSTEVVRYALNGILIDGEAKKIVASDGKRLHIRPFKSDLTFQKLILNKDAVWAMMAAQEREVYEPIYKVGLEKVDPIKTFSLDMGRFTLYAKPVEGHFPDYNAVFPKEFLGQVVVDAEQWRDALKSFRAFFRENKSEQQHAPYHRVRLAVVGHKNAIRLIAMVDKKEKIAEVDVIRGTNSMLIDGASFNGDYLLEASWNQRHLVIQTNGTRSAFVFDCQAIVMPLTLSDGFDRAAQKLEESLKGTKQNFTVEKHPDQASTWYRRKSAPQPKEVPVEPKIVRTPAPKPAPLPKAPAPKPAPVARKGRVVRQDPVRVYAAPAPAPAPAPKPAAVAPVAPKRLRDYDFSTTTPGLW